MFVWLYVGKITRKNLKELQVYVVNGSKKGLIHFGDVPNAGGTSRIFAHKATYYVIKPLVYLCNPKTHSFQAVNELINGLNF